jgi:hypothetical protein
VRLDVEVNHPLRVHVRERSRNVECAADPEVAGGAAARSAAEEIQSRRFLRFTVTDTLCKFVRYSSLFFKMHL